MIGLAPGESGDIVSQDQFDPVRHDKSMRVTSKTGVMDPMRVETLPGLIEWSCRACVKGDERETSSPIRRGRRFHIIDFY